MSCVCLGIKLSTHLLISKSTTNGVVSGGILSLFKNYNEQLLWTTKLFSRICDITKKTSQVTYVTMVPRGNEMLFLQRKALAGLADRSPEGAEERRTPCNAVHPALPQQGPPSTVLSRKHQDRFIEDFLD